MKSMEDLKGQRSYVMDDKGKCIIFCYCNSKMVLQCGIVSQDLSSERDNWHLSGRPFPDPSYISQVSQTETWFLCCAWCALFLCTVIPWSLFFRAVDVWAVGCLIVEMLTGEPLFPGDSDIDQVYHVMRCFGEFAVILIDCQFSIRDDQPSFYFQQITKINMTILNYIIFFLAGNLTQRHQELFYKNPTFAGVRLPEIKEMEPLERRFSKLSSVVLDLVKVTVFPCLVLLSDNYLPSRFCTYYC